MMSRHRFERMLRRSAQLALAGNFTEIGQILLAKTRQTRWKIAERRLASRAPSVTMDARSQRFDESGAVVDKEPRIVFPESAHHRVSVVIPCFNYGHFLGEAVGSVRAQTLDAVEIIIVDDGSDAAGTLAVLAAFEQDPTVSVLRKANGGLVSARNAGLAEATGEYCCCLDADDRLLPNYLESAILHLESDRSCGFAFSWARLFGDEDGVWRTREFDIEEALVDNHTSVCAVFRRDDWVAAGGYEPKMREGYEDWEFWLRLASLGRKGKCIPAPLFEHRRHGHTMTHDAHALRSRLTARMRALNPRLYKDAKLRRRIAGVRHSPDTAHGPIKLPIRSSRDTKPRVLVVLPWLHAGGAEMVMIDVLRGLATNYGITIVTTLCDDNPLWNDFSAITPDIITLAAFPADQRFAILSHLIESRKSRLLLASGSGWLYENARAIKRAFPQIRIADILHNALPNGHLTNAIVASDAIDQHIAVAPHIAEALQAAGVRREKISTVLNGIDAVPAGPSAREASREALGILPGEFAIGWVGRHSPEKRPDDFVALMQASKRTLPVRGFMCGEGPLLEETRAGANAGGQRLTFLGRRPRREMATLYGAFDLLVLTSAVEGLPLVVLEAMGTGCPVLSTKVGDVGLVVEHGVDGFLVPIGDIDAMRLCVERLVEDRALRDAMGERSSTKIADGAFSLAAMQGAYASLLRGMCPNDLDSAGSAIQSASASKHFHGLTPLP